MFWPHEYLRVMLMIGKNWVEFWHGSQIPLIIGEKSLSELYTWIDTAYTIHNNMRGQTAGAIYMGYGLLHGKLSKQKIIVKNSTEWDFLVVSDYLPYKICFNIFMETQKYGIKENMLYQYNKSTMRMQANGRNLWTGNSRHINVSYFFCQG